MLYSSSLNVGITTSLLSPTTEALIFKFSTLVEILIILFSFCNERVISLNNVIFAPFEVFSKDLMSRGVIEGLNMSFSLLKISAYFVRLISYLILLKKSIRESVIVSKLTTKFVTPATSI